MADLIKKAQDYFIIAEISERLGMFDVACTNFFKSLASINDFVLSKINLFPKDHNERFLLLKEHYLLLYRITSGLFLTYRRTYTQEISRREARMLKGKVKEAFNHAGIKLPNSSEIEKNLKK